MGQNLGPLNISSSYQALVQISGSQITDGTGSLLSSLDITATSASYALTAATATTATSASFATTASYLDGSVVSASYAATASTVLGAITSASHADFASDAGLLDGNDGTYYRNADNINAGTLPAARLSGTYNITNSGNAATATTASYVLNAVSSSFATTAATATTATTASFVVTAATASTLGGQPASYYTNASNLSTGTVSSARLSGTYAIDISGDANTLDGNDSTYFRNASNLNTGTLNAARLSGTYTIDIAGNASTATTASFASNIASGLNINATSITASGGEFTNLTATSASIGFLQTVTGSATIIGDAFIQLNTSNATRYAGLIVEDSGSATPVNYTASYFFDSLLNDWNYEYTTTSSTDYGVALFGAAYSSKGTPTYPTNNRLVKGQGNHHIVDSSITDDGSTVSMTAELDVTGGVSASAGFLGNLTGNADTATSATSASFATTASFAANAGNSFLATSASHALVADTATTASYVLNAISASYSDTAVSASHALVADSATTATTASYIAVLNDPIVTGSLNGNVAGLSIASNTASLDLSTANFFTLTLVSGSDTFVNPSNITPGQTVNLQITQPSPGTGSISFASAFKFPSGSTYTPTAVTSSVDVISFVSFDGTTLKANFLQDLV